MPTYGVIMEQAITVADLGANTLITPPPSFDPGDRLQSCSAVMFFNTGNRAAGLYHFPSGDITNDAGSRNVLTAMRNAVQPNEAYIAYGVVDFFSNNNNNVVPSDPFNMELRSFVLGLLPLECRLRRMPARSCIASISQADNQAVIGSQMSWDANDLRGYAAGNYPFGTVYWR